MTESSQTYDVVVLGAGPGGYVCAIRSAQLGLKTAVVEKEWLGGVCLNVGCVPSKALLKNADLALTLREKTKEFGIQFENLQLDYGEAVKRSRKTSKRLTTGVKGLLKKNEVDVIMGSGRLTAANTLQVTAEDGSLTEVKAKNIVLATGAHPMLIPGWNVDGESILTYKEAILQEKLPESVVIIGAGAIGMEFATVWSAYGTKVTIVEMLPQVLPVVDAEVSSELEKIFKKEKINILTGHRVQSVEKTGTGVMVRVESGGEVKTLEAEQALVAVGFKPNVQNIGLEEVGVELDQRGFVKIDERMSTTLPGVWAIGDVSGKVLLAHVASAQGIACAENIAGLKGEELDYRMMPSAVYSHPQVASFGYTEAQALEEGFELKIGRFPFMANGKALGLGDYAGFVKLISDAKTGKLLGAHMIGPDVSELLPELTLAQKNGLSAADIARNVHAHPTLSEAIMEAAHGVEGHPIHI